MGEAAGVTPANRPKGGDAGDHGQQRDEGDELSGDVARSRRAGAPRGVDHPQLRGSAVDRAELLERMPHDDPARERPPDEGDREGRGEHRRIDDCAHDAVAPVPSGSNQRHRCDQQARSAGGRRCLVSREVREGQGDGGHDQGAQLTAAQPAGEVPGTHQ